MNFTKTAKTFADQIVLLKSRGLRIEDELRANHILSNISYYRFSAYLRSYQKYNDPTHTYMPWATFEKVVGLYMFDRDLRRVILDSIERIEVALRCRIVYEFCHSYGNNWYENASLFLKEHDKFMKIVNKELNNSNESFIAHYRSKYTNPVNPPAWMAMEVLSLGQISTMFKNLKKSSAKKAVANYFGVSVAVFESWMEHLTYIRNLCAHHCRLWNRTMTITGVIPQLPSYKWINTLPSKKDKIYSTVCIVAYLLNRVTNRPTFAGEIKVLLKRYNNVDANAAGFDKNWECDNFWESTPVVFTHKLRIVFFTYRNRITNYRHKI
jgi:abortive infection bacteriophage resistance protein